MKQQSAVIIYNREISPHHFVMSLNCPEIAYLSNPGQFVHVRCNTESTLLRRPFSIYNVCPSKGGKNIEILYKVIGKGTQYLSRLPAGSKLDITGPLGKGYGIGNIDESKKEVVLVSGGTGVASLAYLASRLSDVSITVLIGARTKNEVLCNKYFEDIGCRVKVATDDGTYGYKGFVTSLFEKMLREDKKLKSSRIAAIYACGPRDMMRKVSLISGRNKCACQVSLEEYMPCGVGACRGCVVKIKDSNRKFSYKSVCKDGPVFDAREVVW